MVGTAQLDEGQETRSIHTGAVKVHREALFLPAKMNNQLAQLSALLNLLSFVKSFFFSVDPSYALRQGAALAQESSGDVADMEILVSSPSPRDGFWFLHRRPLAVLLGLLTNVSAFYDANFFLLQFFFVKL